MIQHETYQMVVLVAACGIFFLVVAFELLVI